MNLRSAIFRSYINVLQFSVLAQGVATVPFVGCKSDGQIGPLEAPAGTSLSLPISREAAQQLAYYKAEGGPGVLAPRRWYCFGTYGSGGEALLVSLEPIDKANIFTSQRRLAGPVIEIAYRYGDTSGRFDVAEVIARVFPARKAFAIAVSKEFDQPFTFGPYPTDTLTYKSKTMVEYRTPPHSDGLGTHSRLKNNNSPIEGVAILIGPTPDLLHLAARLQPELHGLISAIITQVERELRRHPR